MNHFRTLYLKTLIGRPWGGNWSLPRGVRLSLGTLVLGISVCLVYYPAAHGPFVFDDSATIVDNPSIRQLWPLVGSAEGTGPLNPPRATPVYGRPLVNFTLALNYYFGELDPSGYRFVHIFIHVLSALLVWAIVARTLRLDYFHGKFAAVAELLAFSSALVWALHPLVTESVVYVTQRTELMMGFLYLATLYCAIRYWTAARLSTRAVWLLLATSACILGMFCKEMIASAPAMVLLYERTFIAGSFRRALSRSWLLYLGLSLAWVPAIAFNYHGPRTPMTGFGLGVAAHEWWFTQAKVLFLYLRLSVWPWPLVIHYEIPYLKTFSEAWPWLVAVGLLATGTLVLLWRRSAVGFVAAWVFAVLSPTLVIPLVGETAAERRMYVPLAALVPLFIIGGYALIKLAWKNGALHTMRTSVGSGPVMLVSAVTVVLAIGFGQLSARRLLAYRDELSLWQDAVVQQPDDPLVRVNLGIKLAEAGQFPAALRHFEEAVRIRPDSCWAHYNLARSLEGSQRPQDAMNHYRMAAKLCPDHAASHYNLARLLDDYGDTLGAMKHYRQAIAAQPDFSAAHTNLGILLLSVGSTQGAIKHFEEALRGQEDLVNYVNLTVALSQTNRSAEAIAVAEKALKLAQAEGETYLAEQLEAILASIRDRLAAP